MSFKNVLKQRAKKSVSTKVLGKLSIYDIIKKPIVTEKAYKQTESINKYYFKVHEHSNKNDVKVAIEAIYGVKPKSINIVNVPYKGRARRDLVRRSYKKAIVTLNKDDKIDLIK